MKSVLYIKNATYLKQKKNIILVLPAASLNIQVKNRSIGFVLPKS